MTENYSDGTREIGCALTGHRFLERGYDPKEFQERVKYLVEKEKVTNFYCGMALGFDTLACGYLLKIREQYPQVKVIACIPCPEQADKFSIRDKRIYESLLKDCNEKIVTSECYTNACMHIRNRYMVDHAEFLIAHCTRERGGSAYTVNYARKKGIPVFFV